MSCSCVALPSSFDRFRTIWHVDFEFRTDVNHRPVPVSMFAKEHRTGAEIFMRREQLLTLTTSPIDIGADAVMVAYSAVAELTCFKVLHWPLPRNVLCAYVETCAAINGQDIAGLTEKRPNILEACDLYGIPHMAAAEKKRMRDLIMNNTEYTEEEWREIKIYNSDDVLLDIPLLEALAPTIDMPAALFRGRYLKAAAAMEMIGIPIDVDYLVTLQEHWQALRMHYIARGDTFGLYDEAGSFCEDRFVTLVRDRSWHWPLTPTGRLELKAKTFGKQCRHHPELQPLQRLRDQIAELRLGAFVNTVGVDGSSRIAILPFWAKSGRNLPSERDKAFLLSLPSWIHGLIKPPPGWGIALLDWTAQEVGIAAGLSGDPALIADFQSSDPHLRFAIRAGLAPMWATKDSHGPVRNAAKPVSLGSNYGISKYGVAAQTGKSLLWGGRGVGQPPPRLPRFHAMAARHRGAGTVR
jgi:DNA polymerase I